MSSPTCPLPWNDRLAILITQKDLSEQVEVENTLVGLLEGQVSMKSCSNLSILSF